MLGAPSTTRGVRGRPPAPRPGSGTAATFATHRPGSGRRPPRRRGRRTVRRGRPVRLARRGPLTAPAHSAASMGLAHRVIPTALAPTRRDPRWVGPLIAGRRAIARPAGRRAGTVRTSTTVAPGPPSPGAALHHRDPDPAVRVTTTIAPMPPSPGAARHRREPDPDPAVRAVPMDRAPVRIASPGSGRRPRPIPTCLAPTRSWSPVAAPSRRRSSRSGPRSGCWSSPSGARPSNASSSTRRACGSRSSRSKAGR